jgi:SHAQKYF class myb-like DNA-binding protein
MIVDQQRKIQHLEEELKRTRDQMDAMNSQLNTYEQERQRERKKPQSRYWTPDEHQRFLEALAKYGHKDVKAISMHVSTRNATQVRTHAQKYFLRLERERRKKTDEDGNNGEPYNSSGDEMYTSDPSGSPMEELSPPMAIASPPHPALLQSQPQQPVPPPTRRRRSTSLITPTMGKLAAQFQSAVLAELLTWNAEDYEQFSKGLNAVIEKQDDIAQICRSIRDGYLPQRTAEDIEVCYKQLHKLIKAKPAALIPAPIGSPKRRRTSKPEPPINMPMISEGTLPALGAVPPINGSTNFATFVNALPNMSGSSLPPPQYVSANGLNGSNSPVTLLPFQPPQLGALMNMNMTMNMNMRPVVDYGSLSSMQPLQINSMNMGLGNMTVMDIGSPSLPSASSSHQWNSLALSFDLHQNGSPSISLPHGAPLVPSLN